MKCHQDWAMAANLASSLSFKEEEVEECLGLG